MDKKYMDIAYAEAVEAYNSNEGPVGAVIIRDGQIIATGRNNREETDNRHGQK